MAGDKSKKSKRQHPEHSARYRGQLLTRAIPRKTGAFPFLPGAETGPQAADNADKAARAVARRSGRQRQVNAGPVQPKSERLAARRVAKAERLLAGHKGTTSVKSIFDTAA